MKIRVDKVSFSEFKDYINRTIVKTGSIYMGVLALVGLIALVFGIYKGAVASVLEPVLWFLVFIVIIQILLKLSIRFIYERSGLSHTVCSYSFDTSGLDIKMGKIKGDLSWQYVKKVIETNSSFVIRIPKGTLIIPKRCIKDDEFLPLIKQHVAVFKIKLLKKKVLNYANRKNRKNSGRGN